MVGPIRQSWRKTNFHSIEDLAKSDGNNAVNSCEVLDIAARVPPPHLHTASTSIPHKVRMEPSPCRSLFNSPRSSSTTPQNSRQLQTTSTDEPSDEASPSVSEDSGFGHDIGTPLAMGLSDDDSRDGSLLKDTDNDKLRKYRKQRTVFESEQLKLLEAQFMANHYPNAEQYEVLAERTAIDEARLRIWFQNRRARMRRGSRHSPSTSTSLNLPFHLPMFASSPASAVPRLSSFNTASSRLLYGSHPLLYPGNL